MDELGAKKRYMQYFRHVSQYHTKEESLGYYSLEGDSVSLDVFEEVCEARKNLMGACRLSRVVALETWKREVEDEKAWRRLCWDGSGRFYWVLELEGKAKELIIQRLGRLIAG